MDMFRPMYRELDVLEMSAENLKGNLLEVRANAHVVKTYMEALIANIDTVLMMVDDDEYDDIDPFDMEDDDE